MGPGTGPGSTCTSMNFWRHFGSFWGGVPQGMVLESIGRHVCIGKHNRIFYAHGELDGTGGAQEAYERRTDDEND